MLLPWIPGTNRHGKLACLHSAPLYARIQRRARGYPELGLCTV